MHGALQRRNQFNLLNVVSFIIDKLKGRGRLHRYKLHQSKAAKNLSRVNFWVIRIELYCDLIFKWTTDPSCRLTPSLLTSPPGSCVFSQNSLVQSSNQDAPLTRMIKTQRSVKARIRICLQDHLSVGNEEWLWKY